MTLVWQVSILNGLQLQLNASTLIHACPADMLGGHGCLSAYLRKPMNICPKVTSFSSFQYQLVISALSCLNSWPWPCHVLFLHRRLLNSSSEIRIHKDAPLCCSEYLKRFVVSSSVRFQFKMDSSVYPPFSFKPLFKPWKSLRVPSFQMMPSNRVKTVGLNRSVDRCCMFTISSGNALTSHSTYL